MGEEMNPVTNEQILGAISGMRSELTAARQEIRDLRAYVEQIEENAQSAMAKFSDPNTMMDLAGKFLAG